MQPAAWDQLKAKMRETWMAGDFGRIARFSETEAEEFVQRLNLQPGMRVLDVACGTGNLAIPAARTGAEVIGLDIAPNLLEQARQRAAAEGLSATFVEGDAERLPYPDAHFDVVMTMFGAMFAPRPDVVAAELARVCRAGGRIAMANWTAEGFVGQMFSLGARHVPPPVNLPAPVLWGDEKTVRDRFAASAASIATVKCMFRFDYPFPAHQVVQLFRDYFGPTKMGFARLDPNAQQAYAAAMEQLWRDRNQAAGDSTSISAEYLEVVATKK